MATTILEVVLGPVCHGHKAVFCRQEQCRQEHSWRPFQQLGRPERPVWAAWGPVWAAWGPGKPVWAAWAAFLSVLGVLETVQVAVWNFPTQETQDDPNAPKPRTEI